MADTTVEIPATTAAEQVGKTLRAPSASAIIDGKTIAFTTAEQKLRALADDWLDAQGGRSRIDYSHPSHLQIVGTGAVAIPFLLREVQRRSGRWFEALRSIVGASPVAPHEAADFEAVRSAWLKWGVENGYALDDSQRAVDAAARA